MTEENPLKIDVEKMIPRITEEVAAELRKRAVNAFEYQVDQAVTTAIKEYIEQNIVPHVKIELAKHDVEIRAALIEGIVKTVQLTADKIVESAAKKMASYEGDKILKDVIGNLFRGF